MVSSEIRDTFPQKKKSFLGKFSYLSVLGRAVADSKGEQLSLQDLYFFFPAPS